MSLPQTGTNQVNSPLQEIAKGAYSSIGAAFVGGFVAVTTLLFGIILTFILSLPGRIGLVPKGTVSAFVSAECPSGWSPSLNLRGRVIIGYTTESQLQEDGVERLDENNIPLAPVQFNSRGGSVNTILDVTHIPRHHHTVGRDRQETRVGLANGSLTGSSGVASFKEYKNDDEDGRDPDVHYFEGGRTDDFGENPTAPITNLPPYVALLFCIKS